MENILSGKECSDVINHILYFIACQDKDFSYSAYIDIISLSIVCRNSMIVRDKGLPLICKIICCQKIDDVEVLRTEFKKCALNFRLLKRSLNSDKNPRVAKVIRKYTFEESWCIYVNDKLINTELLNFLRSNLFTNRLYYAKLPSIVSPDILCLRKACSGVKISTRVHCGSDIFFQ